MAVTERIFKTENVDLSSWKHVDIVLLRIIWWVYPKHMKSTEENCSSMQVDVIMIPKIPE